MRRSLTCGLLVFALLLGFAVPANANSLPTNAELEGALAGVIAVAVVVTVLVIHHAHKNATVTGCVSSGPGGMSITDEKNQRVYTLSGSTTGLTPGNRVKLRGKKIKGPGASFTWQTTKLDEDLGLCHP